MGGFIAERLSDVEMLWGSFWHRDDAIWILIGFFGQFFFMMRFVVQWLASEKAGRSVVPELFWWFSLGGGTILLVYACYRGDPVFIFGQGLGFLIYLRNLQFVLRDKRKAAGA